MLLHVHTRYQLQVKTLTKQLSSSFQSIVVYLFMMKILKCAAIYEKFLFHVRFFEVLPSILKLFIIKFTVVIKWNQMLSDDKWLLGDCGSYWSQLARIIIKFILYCDDIHQIYRIITVHRALCDECWFMVAVLWVTVNS